MVSELIQDSYRVVVIGAGVAGLTAASELIEQRKLELNELCVLEAENRIGGRVKSKYFSDDLRVMMETGAAWIHGARENVFMERAATFNMKIKEISTRNPWLHPSSCPNFLVFDGKKEMSDSDLDATWQFYELLLKKLEQLAKSDSADGASLTKESIDSVVERLARDDEELARMAKGCSTGPERVQLCLRLIEIWMGIGADQLQIESFIDSEYFGDDKGAHCLIPAGMERFIDNISKPLKDVIQTGISVEAVHYDCNHGVVLECNGGRRVIHADYVIVTASAGFMKSNKMLFEPELPIAKQQAYERSQMGQYMKVQLQFPSVFWPEEATFMAQICASNSTQPRLIHFPLVMSYYKIKNVCILEAVLVGELAAQISSFMPDREIADALFFQLQDTFGMDIPEPVNHFVSHWDQNAWSCGAYSCHNINATAQDPELMRQTVGDRVLFAGEATNEAYQGALQAAYISGLDAVKELDRLGAT